LPIDNEMLVIEIIAVLALFVLNGFFAMAELAIVSSRRAHLERSAKEGRPGAQVALALADDPARMLAAVQIGFTTTATLAGIFSGVTLAERVEELLVRKQDLIDQVLDGRPPDVEQVTRPPLTVHESTTILRTLDLFRKTPVHTAVVVDEFGAVQGIVTRTDLLETVAGDLPKIDAPPRPKVTRREDGSYLIDASVPFSDVMQLLGIVEAPSGEYVTLAGLILSRLRELPKPGDHVVWAGWRFEVVDMDGRRIDMILAQRRPEH